MSSPYRTRHGLAPPQAPRDTGIVGEIIDQFADRHAFLRELVQNAIDADSPTVEVRAHYNESSDKVTVTVVDEGVGMPREVVEERLLVLFRSTKEDDETKIGKFGVGFASVLAVNPSVVKVTTAHAGKRHTLHLFRDLSFELFDTGQASRSGTTVEVEIELGADQIYDFVSRCHGALERWCRHATVPIHFASEGHVLSSLPRTRVDRPLALDDSLVEVEGVSADGTIRAVVGVPADGEPYAGFFNHGLMLYETREALVGRFAFKVQDARLGHTLSRDNVRRDDRFLSALDFVARLASRDLAAAATKVVEDAAASGDLQRFGEIASALKRAGLRPKTWTLPILEVVDGQKTATFETFVAKGSWTAATPSAVTAYFAERGIPVVALEGAGAVVRELLGKAPAACSALTLAIPQPATSEFEELVAKTESLLDRVHRQPAGIVVAEVAGASAGLSHAACVNRAAPGEPFLIEFEEATSNPFAFFRRRTIVLNANSKRIERILSLADLDLASALLSRLLLLESGQLNVKRSTAILEAQLEAGGFDG